MLNSQLAITWVYNNPVLWCHHISDSNVHRANMGPIWGRQDPGGPHVGPMNIAIWDASSTSGLMDSSWIEI